MKLELPRNATGRVAVIVDRFPCLSESFVRRELACLEAQGLTLLVVACSSARRSDTWVSSEQCAHVIRADECAGRRGRWRLFGAEALSALASARALFPPGPRGMAAAVRAAWLATAIRPFLDSWRPDWIHAHFLGRPAAVACLLTERLGVPLSISAHARDVFVPAVRLARVCSRARFVAACSEQARASLMGRLPAAVADRIAHFPHDVACAADLPDRETREAAPLRLLSVCRLVPKKGVDVVLRALALLKLHHRYRVVGEGLELPSLRALVRELGLKESVEFVGPVAPDRIPAELARADVFVLGNRTAPDGDRDGIPNAMLEAMAAGVPVVVGDAGGVSEVVRHRHTGWLLPPDRPEALAEALLEIAAEPALRRTVAANAHAEVLRRFAGYRNSERLCRRLVTEIAAAPRRSPHGSRLRGC